MIAAFLSEDTIKISAPFPEDSPSVVEKRKEYAVFVNFLGQHML